MFGFSKKERLRRAAEQGHAESQTWLGYAYHTGQGVRQDYAEAIKWYRLAAAQGHAGSQCNLGVMYQNGEGVTRNYSEAASWFYRSAVQGYAHAQFDLAGLYGTGRGVPLDDPEPVKWLRRAAEQGIVAAQDIRDSFEQEGRGTAWTPTEGERRPPPSSRIAPRIEDAVRSQLETAKPQSTSDNDDQNESEPCIRRQSGVGEKLSMELIVERSYSILGEMLFKSVEEGWSFSAFVDTFYISFSKASVTVAPNLQVVQSDNEVICWLKLSKIPLLRTARPPRFGPIPAVPQELMMAAVEIATHLSESEFLGHVSEMALLRAGGAGVTKTPHLGRVARM